jgi:hypothetical protein
MRLVLRKFHPREKVLAWTAQVVRRYHDHTVIVPRRRLIALAAAYAIALQAALSGFVLLATAGTDLCAAASAPAAPHSNSDCGCCPLLCGAAADLAAESGESQKALPLSSSGACHRYVEAALPSPRGLVPPPRGPPAA